MIFDERLLAQCVSCGFCLPSCPTFQVTHREEHGPRGRIAGMRLVQAGELSSDDSSYLESMETCVQCRACEPACPSGVQFGALMEQARAAIHEGPTAPNSAGGSASRAPFGPRRLDSEAPREGASPDPEPPAAAEHPTEGHRPGVVARTWKGILRGVTGTALVVLGSRPLLRILTVFVSLGQLLRLDRLFPAHMRVPRRIRIRDMLRPLPASGVGDPAWLFRGCVMDAWFRPVHHASVRVLDHAGYNVRTAPAPACCGAIHLHLGREHAARKLARKVIDAFRDTEGPIVVNSAGCGAAMQEYGRLVGTSEAKAFSERVRDFSDVVRAGRERAFRPVDLAIVYQSACHLRNVQRCDHQPTDLLAEVPSLRICRPLDGELCCGAGGAYALTQPEFARKMRDRKVVALQETGAATVVSGNPGCMLHLEGAGLRVLHVAEILARGLPESGTAGIDAESIHGENDVAT